MAWVVAAILGLSLAFWPKLAVAAMFVLALLYDRKFTTSEQIDGWRTSLLVVVLGVAILAFEYLVFLLFEWSWIGFWTFLFPEEFDGFPAAVDFLGWFLVFLGLIQLLRKLFRTIRSAAPM
ncbi:MAG: hypothetical protein JNJ55_01975 [Betaproteobacteria bacterium]|nr:hypothetical protein [Betaproteobacteria bacterium]